MSVDTDDLQPLIRSGTQRNSDPDTDSHLNEENGYMSVDRVETEVEQRSAAPADSDTWNDTTVNKVRILAGFWLLGLCNNFGYVVMLSAAYDILQPSTPSNGNSTAGRCAENETIYSPHHLICNAAGTGSILLADILPTLFIKFTAPFYMHKISYNMRFTIVVLFNAGSFLLVGFAGADVKWLSYLGVICASISSGFGEIIVLSLSAHFPSHTVSTWASGTGAAGIFGAISYSGLRQIGLSSKNTLFVMLVVPVLQSVSYYWLIIKPPKIKSSWVLCSFNKVQDYDLLGDPVTADHQARRKNDYTLLQMIQLVKPLLKFMIPLMFVYMAEYFINQTLFELLYFTSSCSWISIESQYRWFQTIYQVGVFLSRSSILCFKLKVLWVLPILQLANVAILLCQVFYHYMPENSGIWIVFALILWEGCLGGVGYVHTFYQISQQIEEEHKEFSMGVASVADTTGIVITAGISILTHDRICRMGITW